MSSTLTLRFLTLARNLLKKPSPIFSAICYHFSIQPFPLYESYFMSVSFSHLTSPACLSAHCSKICAASNFPCFLYSPPNFFKLLDVNHCGVPICSSNSQTPKDLSSEIGGSRLLRAYRLFLVCDVTKVLLVRPRQNLLVNHLRLNFPASGTQLLIRFLSFKP